MLPWHAQFHQVVGASETWWRTWKHKGLVGGGRLQVMGEYHEGVMDLYVADSSYEKLFVNYVDVDHRGCRQSSVG